MSTSENYRFSLFKSTLGKCIEELRTNAGLTQEALALKAGLTRTTIADIEKGAANPSLKGLDGIANAFGLSVTDFFSSGIAHRSRYIMQPTGGNLYAPLVHQLMTVQNGELNIQVAYAKSSGVDLLTTALKMFRSAGGHLRVLAGIDQHNTTAEALYKLLNLCDELYVVHDRAFAQTYHPKLFVIRAEEQAWVAVGSNNLTRGGLCTNYEICHTQVLNLADTLDQQSYQSLMEPVAIYQESDLIKRITAVDDIKELLSDGLIVTEQQSRQNSAKRSNLGQNAKFGHRNVPSIPATIDKIFVPANLFTLERSVTNRDDEETTVTVEKIISTSTAQSESEVTVESFLSLEASTSVQATYWFEMRASTGGSRNILDLSSSAKLQAGVHSGVKNGYIPGSVTFFGLDAKAHKIEKNVTIVYNGISYYPSTIKFAPNNASWRIQLKGDAETGCNSLSQFGRTDFANHILIFHRITPDYYILETMAESELDTLKQNSEFWATNGSSKSSKAFGEIRPKGHS